MTHCARSTASPNWGLWAGHARLVQDPGGLRVLAVEALERRHPAHGAATTGALAGGALVYIADSQLGRLNPGGDLDPAPRPARPVVLRPPLERPCGP